MKTTYLLFIISLFTQLSFGQVITWLPNFPTDSDSITVVFDAAQGSGGLANYAGDVYAHTGVITNLSASGSDWKYVKTNWGVNTPETKLTRIGTNLYEFKIKPSVRAFYAVPQSEIILQVAFVFRSGVQVNGQWLEGKTSTNGDIFLPLSVGGLNVAIINPVERPVIKNLNDTIMVNVVSANSNNLQLYVDGSIVSQTTSNSIEYSIITNQTGKKWVKAVATGTGGAEVADSFYFVVNAPVVVQALPQGNRDGINYKSATQVVLSIYAPEKDYVYVIGDFTNWEVDPAYMMKRTPDQFRYWIEINNLSPGTEYRFQYLVDGNLPIADPYSEKILDPWNDQYISSSTYPNLISYPVTKTSQIVSVLQTGQTAYNWQVTNFQKPDKSKLIIYELLIRDFLATHDYKTLKDTLVYLKLLGVNTIELMPIMEFEGNESWGYNVMFHLAPDKYYGPKNELKKFIDECHAQGIAVILDMVLNHAFGNSPLVRLYFDAAAGKPALNSPYFNRDPKHDYNVGYDFNHESAATQYFVDRVNSFWLSEYKFDGFRFDLSKGFTQRNSLGNVSYWGQYDQSRINILKRMADKLWETDSTAYVILEHFADNSEEVVLSNYGALLWGNMNYNYNEATMGYNSNSNLTWGSYKARGWLYPHLVTYMESHDEERLMFKNLQYGNSSGSYNIKDLPVALNRVKLASAFFFTIPGPKMLWQFGELGYDVSINDPCRVCNKPIKWEYYSDVNRRNLYKVTQALIDLKKNYEAFETTDYTLDVTGAVKRINLYHSTMDVSVVGNFDVITKTANPNFSNTGWWYDFFSGDSSNVTNTTDPISLEPGEFHIYSNVRLPAPEPGILLDVENENYTNIAVQDYLLEQNYPNPFNPTTKIRYTIPLGETHRGASVQNVVLKVYDVLGNEVVTLVDEFKPAGNYEVEFNANRLASGVYFYRLTSGSFSDSKKLILLK